MSVSSHSLAQSLSRRLNKVIPAGFSLSSEKYWLEILIDGSLDTAFSAPEGIEEEIPESAERLYDVVSRVLDSVQETISEHWTIPWPPVDGHKMALAGVRLDDNAIHLWYGENETSPVLAIPEIPFAEIAVDR